MEITRNLSRDGTFCPSAVNILGQIPAQALFFSQHQLRHPESIYLFSLGKLGEAFERVAQGYLSKAKDYGSGYGGELDMCDLLQKQESLLRALQEHLDDCYLILRTLVNPVTAKKTTHFADRYVIENKLPGAKSFQSAVSHYKKNHLRIANKLKHQQARLRGIAIWLPAGAHLGYFLEEPDPSGQIGPSPEIHPDQGCISFARDLTWHLFNAYLCSEKLATAVCGALSGLYGVTPQPRTSNGDKNWDSLARLACTIPQAFFPKEVRKHAATFHLSGDGQTLIIRFPDKVKLVFPPTVSATCSTVVDGHSTNFKVPLP
ncbi:MAG TPA: hypothetical protein VJR04_13145 [Terriglobales bacterium]|nr:hypothetical protein [Terriglobales bacterium]HKT25547.1 hypothetical protein [Terriglobales bacterium]